MRFDDKHVFLASRFEDFAPLRRALRERIASQDRRLDLKPLDLNDGAATHLPPLAESLAQLHRARFMILLIGEHYGNVADGQNKSYVELEYEAALKTEGNIYLLVFGIGPSYAGGRIAHSSDARLTAFQCLLQSNHTLRYFDGTEAIDDMAAEIFHQLLYAVCFLRGGDVAAEAGDFGEGILPEDVSEDEEIASLELRYGNAGNASPASPLTVADALTQPQELAAREQCREADEAIRLGEFRIARDHLQRAIKMRPIDVEANYRLARLYIASGQRKRFGEAIERLDLVRRIFERDGQRYRVCDCLLLQAKAMVGCGDSDAALRVAKKACLAVPGYGRARYAHARLLLEAGRADAARGELLEAVKRYFALWPRAQRDPVFGAIIRHVGKDVDRWLRSHRQLTQQTLDAERAIAGLTNAIVPALPGLDSISNPGTLWRLSCDSIRRQHVMIAAAFWRVADAMKNAGERPMDLPARSPEAAQDALSGRRAGLASAQYPVFIVRLFAAVMPAAMLGAILAWSLLPTSFVLGTVFVAGLLLIRLASGLPAQPQPDSHPAPDEAGVQLKLAAATPEQRVDKGAAQQLVFARAFSTWCGSLAREGRHQPFAEVGDALKPGDLVVADREGVARAGREYTIDSTSQDAIACEFVGASGEHARRLYRVVGALQNRLALSETAAYPKRQQS